MDAFLGFQCVHLRHTFPSNCKIDERTAMRSDSLGIRKTTILAQLAQPGWPGGWRQVARLSIDRVAPGAVRNKAGPINESR